MADTLLGIAIENLGSLVREEVADFLNIGQLTQKLSQNLTAIRAVLRDAEEKQITSHAVKDWLQKLTDAAHVLDDILDEASIQQSTNRLAHDSTCVTRFHPKSILARCNIGKRMKEIAQRFNDIAEERSKFELHTGILESHAEDNEWRQTTSAITEPIVYGRDQDKERVVEFLLRYVVDIEELSVYSIVGLGGLGKTTLAQLVFKDDRVSKHFDLKIWVCVSDDFSMMKILKSIIESATGENPNLLSLESMQKKVQEVLQNKRYLIVLDDVWNEDQGKWDKFKYFIQCENGPKGSALLVTTRLDSVASMTGTYPAHHLLGLSDNDIWSLFKQHAFGPGKEERAELLAIGKDIVRKCVGSPLAAKALGSILRFKNEEYQWLAVKESKIWNLPEDNPIMKVLRLSYFNLKLSLRPCFSFCATFPKDSVMVKEELIHLWMANGFISSRGSLEVEYVGNEVWNELYQRSFFQLGGKLHIRGLENAPSEWDARQANLAGKKDLNRLYLTWGRHGNSQGNGANAAECILEALKPHSGLESFGMKGYGGTQLPQWMGNNSLLRGLVDLILYDCKNCQRLPLLGKLPCLAKLFISGMKDVKYIDHDLYDPTAEKAFVSLKRLTLRGLPNLERILEAEAEGLDILPVLSDLSISGVPKLALPSLPSVRSIVAHGSDENAAFLPGEVLRSMHGLKKLRIEGFNKLKVLSDELGYLGELEDLDISFCAELESFPDHVMRGISSLRSLSIFFCPKFKSFSEGMGQLTCLESLQIIDCPPQLVLPSNMNQLTTLRKVRILGKEKNSRLPEGLERIPSLQILELSEFPSLTSLPDWLGLMTSLQELEIRSCPELRSLPDSLQQLKNLRELRIYGCPKLEKRCKKETGEDWQKIAHVPDRDIHTEPTFCCKFMNLSLSLSHLFLRFST